jgi:hypothetical protein
LCGAIDFLPKVANLSLRKTLRGLTPKKTHRFIMAAFKFPLGQGFNFVGARKAEEMRSGGDEEWGRWGAVSR